MLLTEFDVHSTEPVIKELEETSEYDDRHGDAAQVVLDNRDQITVHDIQGEFTSSRVDEGEGSCALLIKKIDAEFLITDDLRALPELQTVADAKVAIAPIRPQGPGTEKYSHGRGSEGEARQACGDPRVARRTDLQKGTGLVRLTI